MIECYFERNYIANKNAAGQNQDQWMPICFSLQNNDFTSRHMSTCDHNTIYLLYTGLDIILLFRENNMKVEENMLNKVLSPTFYF